MMIKDSKEGGARGLFPAGPAAVGSGSTRGGADSNTWAQRHAHTDTPTHRFSYNNDMPTNADHTHICGVTPTAVSIHSLIYAQGHTYTNTRTVMDTDTCQHILT